jgi:hypothetical protein
MLVLANLNVGIQFIIDFNKLKISRSKGTLYIQLSFNRLQHDHIRHPPDKHCFFLGWAEANFTLVIYVDLLRAQEIAEV